MYKIAIIEDSATVNNALADFCRKIHQSVEVEQFYDRAHAEIAIKANNYSLIVMDIELPPERDAGIGLIHVNSHAYKSPVIVVSGLDSSVYRSIMYQLAVWDFLEKPVAPDGQMFLAAAMRVLRDSGNAQSAKASQDLDVQVEEIFSIDHDTGKASFKGKPFNIPHTAKTILQRVYKKNGALVAYDELFDLVKSGKNNDALRQHIKIIKDALREVDGTEHVEVIRMRGIRWVD